MASGITLHDVSMMFTLLICKVSDANLIKLNSCVVVNVVRFWMKSSINCVTGNVFFGL